MRYKFKAMIDIEVEDESREKAEARADELLNGLADYIEYSDESGCIGSLEFAGEEEGDEEPIGQELLAPKVTASCHTDDYRVVVEVFDATLWFATADDEDIQRLRDEEWCNSDIADSVAEDAAEENKQVAEMFTYLGIINSNQRGTNPVGFECHVNSNEAITWVRQHRPPLAIQWLREKEEGEPGSTGESPREEEQEGTA